jgi:hypothetical protein
VPFFEGMARAAPHGRQILVVHFDQMIEKISFGLHQKTGEHRVPLGRSEPFQRMHIVAFTQQRQVAHDAGVDRPEVNSIGNQIVDLPVARDIGENHPGARLWRIFLQAQKG